MELQTARVTGQGRGKGASEVSEGGEKYTCGSECGGVTNVGVGISVSARWRGKFNYWVAGIRYNVFDSLVCNGRVITA